MKYLVASLAIILALIGLVWAWPRHAPMQPIVETPESVAASTTEATSTPSDTSIRVSSPLAETQVARTFDVHGEARGGWYFEASFPVSIRRDGEILARSHAEAQGDWMTASFVPFVAHIDIPASVASGPATLVLMKDNPSGLPENDDAFEVPIVIQ